MSTDTLVRPDRTDTDTGDRVFHYVKKSTIAQSAVEGTTVIALCGERFQVTRSPKPGAPVCDECKRIFAQLPAGGGE